MTTTSESTLLESVPNQLYIGGRWIDAEGGRTI